MLAILTGGLQLAVACGLLARAPERRATHTRDLVGALPSLLLAGVVIAAAGRQEWGPLGLALLGVVVAAGGMVSLGTSFAVLPGVRTLRTTGLYRWVRHPIYLGESLLFAAGAAQLGGYGWASIAAMVPLLAWPIGVEERLLAQEPDWAVWSARVRWRLLPGVW